MQPSKTVSNLSPELVFPSVSIDAAKLKLIRGWAFDLVMVGAFAAAFGALSVWDW